MTIERIASNEHPMKSNSDAKERRRGAARHRVDIDVDYHCRDTYLFAYVTDISETGIFIRTATPEKPGTSLNLRFTPPGTGESLEFEGQVAWVCEPGRFAGLGPGMGIRFVAMNERQRTQLGAFLERYARSAGT